MSKQNPEKVEQEFFTALVGADHEALNRLLSDDFQLIDVMTGSVVSKAAFREILGESGLRFDEINRIDYQVRIYGSTAIITGQTEMFGHFNGRRFEMASRYTHVLVEQGNGWRLVAAQGTQIIERRVMAL